MLQAAELPGLDVFLIPAWVSAGICLVVIAAGILIMMRVQYWRPASTATDAERANVARGLRVSAVVGLALAGLAAAGCQLFMAQRYGDWPQCIPAGIAVSSLMFLVAGKRNA